MMGKEINRLRFRTAHCPLPLHTTILPLSVFDINQSPPAADAKTAQSP